MWIFRTISIQNRTKSYFSNNSSFIFPTTPLRSRPIPYPTLSAIHRSPGWYHRPPVTIPLWFLSLHPPKRKNKASRIVTLSKSPASFHSAKNVAKRRFHTFKEIIPFISSPFFDHDVCQFFIIIIVNIKLSRCLIRLEMDIGYNCLFTVTYIFRRLPFG